MTSATRKGTKWWQLGNQDSSLAWSQDLVGLTLSSPMEGTGDNIVLPRHEHQQGVSQALNHVCLVPSFRCQALLAPEHRGFPPISSEFGVSPGKPQTFSLWSPEDFPG